MNTATKKLFYSAKKNALLFCLTLFSVSINATNFVVNTTADTHASNPAASPNDAGGNISFRSAMEHIDAIGGVHTITLSSAVYNLTLGQILFGSSSNRSVTINGNGPANTIIDGGNIDRIILTNLTGLLDNIVLNANNVTFRNGRVTSDAFGGGAIYVGGGTGNSATFSNVHFLNNTAPSGTGGAINANPSGDLTVTNSTFSGNTADSDGGAIYFLVQNNFNFFTGALTVTNSTFSNNSVVNAIGNVNGGAIAVSAQSPLAGQTFSVNIKENTFLNNTADGYGGAISANNSFNTPVSSFKINYNRFIGNTAATDASTAALHVAGSAGSVDATNNWWGCNTGPSASPCNRAAQIGAGGGTTALTPYLQLKLTASPNPICNTPEGLGNTSLVTASFLSNSGNQAINVSDIDPLIGLPVTWGPTTLGSLSGQQNTIQASGTATALFTSNGTGGSATVNAQVDNIPTNDVVARATITVNTKPTVTGPSNQVVCEQSTTTFTATITGTPAPTIQWYKGATPINDGGTGNGSTYVGTNTATLQITNTQLADAGTYHVEASNVCSNGPVVGPNATLTVEPLPNLSTISTSAICNKGTVNIAITQPNGVGGTYNRSTGALPAGVTHTAPDNENGIAYGPNFTDVVTNTTALPQVISYTFTPIGGPTLNCPGPPITVNITVEPKPTITCPASPVTVNVAPGTCSQVVNGIAPATTSCPANCGPCTITYATTGATTLSGSNDASGQTFNKGTTVVTYTIVDAGTNSTTCSFNVVVNDNELPTLICPANQVFSTSAGLCTAPYIITDPITDNCPGATWSAAFSGNVNGNPSNFGPIADGTDGPSRLFEKGTTTVTITGTDAVGNIAVQCTFTVTVNDTEVPVLTCPANQNLIPTPGQCQSTYVIVDPISDNCPGSTWNATFSGNPISNPLPTGNINDGTDSAPIIFQKGTTTVTVNGTDAAGNPAVLCTFTVTVVDNQPPVVTCPANVTVSNDPGVCTGTYTINDPVSDNCPGATWSATFSGNPISNPAPIGPINDGSNSAPITFQNGVTTVTISALDASGNTAITCTFTVTVDDIEPPVVTCPANQVLSAAPGSCTGTYTIIDPLSDNCSGATWSATFSGNVNGNPAPTGPIADGNNSAPISFFKGVTTVTINAVDASGNPAAPCTFTVTFNDNTPPTLTCPANQTFNAQPGICTAPFIIVDPIDDNCPGATWSATFSGNVNGNPAPIGPINDGTNSSPVSFQKGTTTVTVTGIDASGNAAVQCTFTVTVNDTQLPVLTCPGNVNVNTSAGVCTASYVINDPLTDNCPGSTWTASFSGNPNGNPANIGPIADGSNSASITFQKGVTTVTLNATDASGNAAVSCTFTVTVTDNELPVLTCPGPFTFTTSFFSCVASVSIPGFLSDNCPGATYSLTFSGNPNGNPAPEGPIPAGANTPFITYQKGTTTVTVNAVDASGNTATCNFTVTVNDNEQPNLSCPGNQTLSTSAGNCSASYTIPNALLDNCPGGTWTATFSGNPNGNPGPVTTPGGSSATVIFNKGTTTINITGQDASGNPGFPCSFTVTVNDTEAPVLTCPANQTISTSVGLCTGDYNILDPIFDNCPGSTWSVTFSGNPNGLPANFGPVNDGTNSGPVTFFKGTTTVTITGVDASGNPAAPCNFTVTVNDTQAPVLTCPGNQTFNTAPGLCTVDFTINDPISDNCTGATWSVVFSGNPNGNPANFGPIADGVNGPVRTFQKGTTTVTVTGVDASGNVVSCQFTVTLNDNQVPTLSCPGNQVLSTAPGSCTGTYSIPDPVSDNCPGSTWSASFSGNPNGNPLAVGPFADGTNSPPISFQKGVTTVTISAIDASGNNAVTCSFTVTFNDVTPPVVTCPANVVLNTAPGLCTANYTIFDPVSDNCAGATWSATFSGNANGNPGNIGPIADFTNSLPLTFQKGVTTVTITGVDASGNVATQCSFTVTVNDNQPPAITCPGNQVFNTNNAGCTYLQNTNAFNPTTTDNCPGTTLQYTLSGATTGSGSTLNGQAFNVGLTFVNWVATDASGNSSGCSFTVTVNQTNGVLLTGSNNEICAGQDGGVLVNLSGTAPFNGSFNILNTTTNTSTTYNWTSNQPGGPQNILIPAANIPNNTNSTITYTFTWNSMVDANGCSGLTQGSVNIIVYAKPAITVTRNPGSSAVCPGSTITYTVAAAPGNTVPATFNYSITEAGNPTPLQQGSNLPYGTVVFLTPSCLYNKVITFTATPYSNQTPSCLGTPVTNTVTVQDIVAPAMTGTLPGGNLGNICLANVPAAPSASTIRAQFTDNCTPQGSLSVSAAVVGGTPGGGSSCNWTRTYTYVVSDACGNTASAVVTYTGNDSQGPTWTTTATSLNRTVQYCDLVALNNAQALQPAATDNCSAVTIIKTPGVFAQTNCPTQGVITNTFVAVDACNNTSTLYTQTITVVDNQGPVISGATPQVLNINGGNCSANLPNYITSLPITATDCAAPGGVFPAPTAITYNNNNTGNNLIWQSPAPGTQIFGVGGQIVPVTITAMDACGNSSSVTINVSLQDLTLPTARCHPITVNLSTTVNAGSVTVTPSQIDGSGAPLVLSSDNCGPVTLTFLPGNTTSITYTCANIGVNNITLNVTDGSGNSATCATTITVVDNTRPTFTCPGPQNITKNANCIAVLPDFVNTLGLTATDNCTPSGSIVWTQTPAAGTILGAGVNTTNVTLTATDANGNVSSPVCNITVNFVDNIPPAITCPPTVNATTGPGNTNCNVAVTYTLPTATDNCQGPGFPGAVPVTLVSGPASGGQFFVGTTPVTYRATDAAGNSSTCTFNVVVTENTVPTITCGANQTVSAGVGCVYTYNQGNAWNPAAFDNCLLAPTPFTWTLSGATTSAPFVAANLNGRTFNLGTTNVSVTATDASGNVSAPCTFTVTVIDNAAPSFSNCPSSYTVTTAAPNGLSGCRASVAIQAPTVTGNCTTIQEWFITAITSGTPNSSGVGAFPSTYPMNVGITQVQFRVSDANGNSTTCTYNVTVQNVVAGAISGTATAGQNAATTSTITFTGSGGTANYCFTYDVSVNGGPFGAPQTVCTTGGQNAVTVAQSNAVIGTYQYRLLSVTDASGCAGTVTAPNTATVTVITGSPDLTSSQFFSTTQISAGGTIDEVIVIRNVGTVATSGPITVNVTNYSPLTGLTVSQLPGGTNVTIGIDTYTLSNGWTFNAGTGQLSTNNVIPAGGNNVIGLRITRGIGASAGANGSVTQTTTVPAGTGGGETPSTNNTISNSILKN